MKAGWVECERMLAVYAFFFSFFLFPSRLYGGWDAGEMKKRALGYVRAFVSAR